jgi:HSP20 family molecular chaperone IbpA
MRTTIWLSEATAHSPGRCDSPQRSQEDKVKASYKDGVLTITLPKTERAKERAIKIEVG